MPNKKEIEIVEEAFEVKEELIDESDLFIDPREMSAQIPVETRVDSFIQWHKEMKFHD